MSKERSEKIIELGELFTKEDKLSEKRYNRDRNILEKVIETTTNPKDIFIFQMLISASQEIRISDLNHTIAGYKILALFAEDEKAPMYANIIEQMQKDIAEIKEDHNPVIEAIKTAYENKRKWMKENR